MSEQTKISWTDSTWNPWRGCEPVSPGCAHCYAKTLVERWGGDFSQRVVAADATFNAPLKWRKKPFVCDECGTAVTREQVDIFDCPNPQCMCHSSAVHPSFHRRRVFLGSLMDWLDPKMPVDDPKMPVDVLARVLGIIRRCPELDFLCVTKRPELWYGRVNEALLHLIHNAKGNHDKAATAAWLSFWKCGEQVPRNVWLITTVENQEMAEKRIPELQKIPAVVRGLSVEPMLGPIRFRTPADLLGIHWVIFGGESGPRARTCNVDWIRDGVRQCKAAGVAAYVKQLGSKPRWNPDPNVISTHEDRVCAFEMKHPGADPAEWPEDLRVQQWPNTTQ